MILFGLKFGEDKAADVMLKYLRDKYNEEFEIKEIRYWNYTYSENNHYTGKAYPKNYPNLVFDFGLTKRHKVKGDHYMNVIMAEKVKEAVIPIIKEMFHPEMKMELSIYHGNNAYPNGHIVDKKMHFNEYFEQQRESEIKVNIPILFPSPNDIIKDEEAARINSFIQRLQELGLHGAKGEIFYLKPDTYNYIKKMTMDEIYNINEFDIYTEEYSYNVCEFEQKGNSNKVKRYYHL